ncbi:MAG: MBL fold metallo-hydrolase [Acidobacteria bacterium]|nr:MBL fold metallo-hydrolase [Acidobacteriota bacterium]
MVKVCALASSSSGNSIYVSTGRTRILIDAGLSRRETFRRISLIGEDPEKLDAILVTHEHSDHVAGLIRIARKLHIPIYASRLTAQVIDWDGYTPKLEAFQAGTSFSVGEIEVQSFSIPHDAVDPVGFALRAQGVKIGVATDLGYLPESIHYHLRGTHCLLLESNHDLDMLKVGPYPWSVKQRVMSRRGHLSNDVVSQFIQEHLDSSVATLMLGHISEHNNHPEIVRLTAAQAIEGRRHGANLVVLDPGKQSEAFVY